MAVVTDANPIIADILKRMATRKSEAPERVKANKQAIIAVLKQYHLGGATATYSGSCDSGQIDEVSVRPGKLTVADALNPDIRIPKDVPSVMLDIIKAPKTWSSAPSQASVVNVKLEEAIEDLLYDWLSSNHGGWENNEGADGEMDLDVETGEVTFTHNMNIMSQETETETL